MKFKLTWTCLLFFLMAGVSCIEKVSSFEEMASLHCNSFPVELLYRLSTGQLS